jgi:hypothetical protein
MEREKCEGGVKRREVGNNDDTGEKDKKKPRPTG